MSPHTTVDVRKRSSRGDQSCAEDPVQLPAARPGRIGHTFLWEAHCCFRNGLLALYDALPTIRLKQTVQKLAKRTAGIGPIKGGHRVFGPQCEILASDRPKKTAHSARRIPVKEGSWLHAFLLAHERIEYFDENGHPLGVVEYR